MAALTPAPTLRGVLSDADIDDLRIRNYARMQRVIERLGSRWLLAVRVARLTVRRNDFNRRTT